MRELMVQLASIRGMLVLLISVWKIDLMYNVTFETSHGKNVCDGLGSTPWINGQELLSSGRYLWSQLLAIPRMFTHIVTKDIPKTNMI